MSRLVTKNKNTILFKLLLVNTIIIIIIITIMKKYIKIN